MENKFIVFIIGTLIGAIISTGAFYIYNSTNNKCQCAGPNSLINSKTPPNMPNGQPPEMPNNNSQNSN